VGQVIDTDFAFQRLKNWFVNHTHASAATMTTQKVLTWQPLLQRLHQIRNPRPRRRKAVNQFISDYATEIDDAVATVLANRPKLDSCQRMNIRYEVAQSLLKSKGADFIEELERKAAAQHEAAKEEWNLILEDISAAEDVSQYVLFPVLDFAVSLLRWQGSRYTL
jgi:hypothetical protein